jgi:cytochrome c-type biogenesis protein
MKAKNGNRWWLPIFLSIGIASLIIFHQFFGQIYALLQDWVALIENNYEHWLRGQNLANPLVLIMLAFLGGLLSSVSPCILALLPVNLSYIGTLSPSSFWEALRNSGAFVFGAIAALSILGLFASLANVIYVDYRGYVNIGVGILTLFMGSVLAGVFNLPLPQKNLVFDFAGLFGVGLTYALVSSPCASPVLFSILAAAATSGSRELSVLTMVSYAIGYTAIIFLSSLFTGLATRIRSLLKYSDWFKRIGSAGLILAGLYFLIIGIGWFL